MKTGLNSRTNRKENICMKRIVILLVLSFLFANFIVAAASNDDLLISEIVVRPGNSVVSKCNFMDGKADYFYLPVVSGEADSFCKITAEAEFSYNGEVLQTITTDIKANQVNKDWIGSAFIKFSPSEFDIPSGELYFTEVKVYGYTDSDNDGLCDLNPHAYDKKSVYSEICPERRLTLFNSLPKTSFYDTAKTGGLIEIVQYVQNSGLNEFCRVVIDTDYYARGEHNDYEQIESFVTDSSTVSEQTPLNSSYIVGAWTRFDPEEFGLETGDVFRISTKACGFIDADNDGVCDSICRSMSVMTEDKVLCDTPDNCADETVSQNIE